MSTITTEAPLSDRSTRLHSARPSFTGLVRGELFKVSRQWTPWILLVLVMGVILMLYVLGSARTDLNSIIAEPGNAYFYSRVAAGLALLRAFGGLTLVIVTARIIGQEYSLGTIRVLLARGVGRVQLLLTKMLAAALWALFTVILCLAEMALLTVLQVQLGTGNLNALINLPTSVWHDLGVYLLVVLMSMGVTILMASAVSVVFRSLAGALSGSIAWFPIDNMAVLILLLLADLTKSDFWTNVSMYLLGPNLNIMAGVLAQQNNSVWNFGIPPQGTVDSTHALLVVLVYAVVFAFIAIGLTWKRDVKE